MSASKAARLGTSQAELKDGTTRAPIVWFLSCQRAMKLKPSLENPDHFETSTVIFNRMDMVTKGVHNVIEFLSDDSPNMDVIGISDNFFSDINKPAAVTCIEGHGSSLGRFKSHASNIVFDEHSENILPSSEGDVGLAASSGPSVLGDKVDEECAAADPPEISDAQNNRKRCRVHNVIEFLSDDSPDMDVIGISDNFFSDINKPAAVNCIEGHGSSLGRFKSHASNIVFDVFIATCQDQAQNMESSQIDGSH
ncbi:hypothetical protein DY000_02009333 [Brassica cretica]|uniref:Uncharacterized protein n=1 Tax=Brassica cretica TaxID=69181 RepID=A0ABQ7C6T3_BRACR|nr:hypothetical protein DY000_02009333 [Brassica cretica]